MSGRQLDQAPRQLDRRLMRQSAEHHVRDPLELRAQGGVEVRVAVAVDRAPPRRHAIDQLAAVAESQPHAARGLDQQWLLDAGHRAVRMPDVRAVQGPQLRVAFEVGHGESIESG